MPKTSRPAAFYKPDALQPEESLALLSKRVLHSIGQQVDRRLADSDLTHTQWVPLFFLSRRGPCTHNELARELQTDPGAVSRGLDRLEAKGLVTRERSTDDRRVVKLALTAAGSELAEAVPPVLADVMNAHLAGFKREEWRQLVDLLQRVLLNGEALRQDAAGKESA
ncbi:transcriptional regulator [Burkholderiales bacterium JOSHI_001]|nr:transcriptional regulator [Burkholderiales bacterium JOSHI_001]